MPLPLATASSAKTRRTSVASTPSAAAIPLQTPATTRSSSLRRTSSCSRAAKPPSGWVRVSPAVATDNRLVPNLDVAQPDGEVEDEAPLGLVEAGLDDPRPEVPAAVLVPEDLRVAGAHLAGHRHGDVVGHVDVELADADARGDMGLAGREPELAEIELELADAEAVVAIEIAHRRGPLDAVADPALERHVVERERAGHREGQQEADDAERRRSTPDEAERDERAGDDDPGGEHDAPVDVDDVERVEQADD